MEAFDSSGVPKAHSFKVFCCGHCPHGHVVFFNADDRPVLVAVLSAHQVRDMAREIEGIDPNFREIGSE